MKYLAVLLLVAALGATPPSRVVSIKDDAYAPLRLTVPVGATVTFVNRDDDAHTVTSTKGWFDSKGLDTDGVWKHTFSKPGVYTYFCELHPFMKGTIVVKAGTP